MSELNKHEIEVLEMLDGRRESTWGAWVSVCLEALHGRGLATPMPYQITDEGRSYLRRHHGEIV